jgi:hypothetical protein
MVERRRRFVAVLFVALLAVAGVIYATLKSHQPIPNNASTVVQPLTTTPPSGSLASTLLEQLPVKGRAPKTGYSRKQFSDGWAKVGACDMRNHILARDMTNVKLRAADGSDCTVLSGTLNDPYTGKVIAFQRGVNSSAVQIDHIVAVSDAWQKGAQALTAGERHQLYNDPLELIAADGPANNDKGDGDAATWLPPNRDYRCRYVARQVAVKVKYRLWVTQAEHDAIQRVLSSCPTQVVPLIDQPAQ